MLKTTIIKSKFLFEKTFTTTENVQNNSTLNDNALSSYLGFIVERLRINHEETHGNKYPAVIGTVRLPNTSLNVTPL
jgi:hypothetical protein